MIACLLLAGALIALFSYLVGRMAERDRCYKIAESLPVADSDAEFWKGYAVAASRMVFQIRGGAKR